MDSRTGGRFDGRPTLRLKVVERRLLRKFGAAVREPCQSQVKIGEVDESTLEV